MSAKAILEPVDLKQCQAWRKGVDNWCGTLRRCKNKPIYFITQRRPQADGLRGSMSVCQLCLKKAFEVMPGMFSMHDLVIAKRRILRGAPSDIKEGFYL
jgi:hypothetical protein